MTLADLRAAVEASGLELVALVPWYQRALLTDIGPQFLGEVRLNYPTATIDDLFATFVALVARRPARA